MSQACKTVGNFVRIFDIFPSAEFLRYKGDPYYQTITGGCISIMIMIAFIILFTSMGLQTARKEIIFSSSDVKKQAIPTLTQMNLTIEEGFMFAFGADMMNLNDPNITYFDI